MLLSSAAALKKQVAKLQAERQAHANAIAEINAVFAELGIAAGTKRGPGRPKGSGNKAKKKKPGRPKKLTKPGRPKKKATPKRSRKKFAVPGHLAILQAVKASGKAGATTAALVEDWKKQGRGGSPYKTIGELVDEGKLRRKSLKGQRGSVYTLE